MLTFPDVPPDIMEADYRPLKDAAVALALHLPDAGSVAAAKLFAKNLPEPEFLTGLYADLRGAVEVLASDDASERARDAARFTILAMRERGEL